MKKTDKKIENQLRQMLTDICESEMKKIDGFQWITHSVNFKNFPQSLVITFVFDSDESLTSYVDSVHNQTLISLIQSELKKLNIKLKDIAAHLIYETEKNA